MRKAKTSAFRTFTNMPEKGDFFLAKRRFRKFDAYKGAWLRFGKRYVLLLVALLVVLRFIVGISWVNGQSMYPTLDNGTALIYLRLDKDFQIGDIVAFKMAYGEYYIKRVVALPGDTVDLVDGILTVNGTPESGGYAYGETHPQESQILYPYTVQDGQVFVLGDNREGSIDSRTFGSVAKSQILGKVVFHLG